MAILLFVLAAIVLGPPQHCPAAETSNSTPNKTQIALSKRRSTSKTTTACSCPPLCMISSASIQIHLLFFHYRQIYAHSSVNEAPWRDGGIALNDQSRLISIAPVESPGAIQFAFGYFWCNHNQAINERGYSILVAHKKKLTYEKEKEEKKNFSKITRLKFLNNEKKRKTAPKWRERFFKRIFIDAMRWNRQILCLLSIASAFELTAKIRVYCVWWMPVPRSEWAKCRYFDQPISRTANFIRHGLQ